MVASRQLKYLSQEQVMKLTGISRTTLFRMRRDNQFPRPQPFRGLLRWQATDVLKWMAENDPNSPDQNALVEKLSEV